MCLYIGVYLVGCVLCYIALKRAMSNDSDNWTVSDRRSAIFLSISSWAGVVSALIASLIIGGNNKKSNW